MSAPHKPARVRSPSYPSIDLESAIKRAQILEKFSKRTPVLISIMLPHWGFESGKSANGMKLVAALKSYGLIEDSGKKETRKIVITNAAFRIIHDQPESEDRKMLIKECALMPEMYRYMWDQFGEPTEMPQDGALKSHLVIEKRFNSAAIKGFLDDYRKTVEYAQLSKDDILNGEIASHDPSMQTNSENTQESDTLSFGAGFIGGPVSPATQQAGDHAMKQERFALDNGDVIIQWPSNMSKESFEDFSDWLDILKRKVKRSVDRGDADQHGK